MDQYSDFLISYSYIRSGFMLKDQLLKLGLRSAACDEERPHRYDFHYLLNRELSNLFTSKILIELARVT